MSLTIEQDDLEFDDIPPFPSDVETVPLLRISLQKLLHRNPAELERLWQACQNIGFFYLDLGDGHNKRDSGHGQAAEGVVNGTGLIEDAAELFDLAEKFYELPIDEKVRYDFREQGSYFGYKGFGQGVIDKQGTRDRNEFYNTSKDFVLGLQKPLPEPEILKSEQSRALMKSFIYRSHAVVTLLLDLLNTKLELPDGQLSSLHRLRAVSGDQIRWVRSPPQPQDDRQLALGEHTDFGSITLLFNRLGGLQVLPPNQHWAYVKPLKRHCIVNLGDALVKFSAGLLRSNVHRVVNAPGAQEQQTRMSLVYFARPEDEVMLHALSESELIAKHKPEQEEQINARDWIMRRALGRRVGGDFDAAAGTESKT